MELNKLFKRKQRAIAEGNKLLTAEMCNKIGMLYFNQNKLQKAIDEFKEEAKLYEELNMRMDCGRSNRMLAEVYILQEQLENAVKHQEIYMKSAKEENDIVELQRAYVTLARIYLLKGQKRASESDDSSINDFKSAEKAFLKGLIIAKEVSKDISKFQLADMQSRIYLNLGITKEEMKSFDEAIEYYKTALKLCKANDLYELQHKCFMCIGFCYTSRYNDSSSAMQSFNNAFEVAKRIDGKNERICETLVAKSDLLIKNGDFQSAKKILKKAFKLKTSCEADMDQIQKNLKVIHVLCKFEDDLITTDSFDYEKRKMLFEKLGDGSCKLKNYNKAIEFYLKQLESAELNGDVGRILIPIYVSLYQTYIDMGEYEEAKKFLDLEYELVKNDPKEACSTLLNMANLLHLAKKDFWDVDAVYRKALSEARKAEDETVEKAILKKLVSFCRESKMTSLAEILEQEAEDRGINLNGESDDVEMSEDLLDSCDIDALDFELSTDPDSSDGEKSLTPKATVRKKRSIAVKKNAKGETKLHEACISGNYQLAKMLLDQGHPVNIRDNAGWMCIHEASNHGHRDLVELLLDNGAQSSINDKGGINCDGITPLYDAASNGHLSVVQLLIERGAKPNIKTDSNQTPLDALLIWHSNSNDKLTASEKEFYEEIKERLVKQCEKVGMDLTKSHVSASSSGYLSAKSRHSQPSQSRQNNMRYSTKFSDTSDDENDDNINCKSNNFEAERDIEETDNRCTSSDNNTVDESHIKKNARHEYKSVMQKLKYPHKECKYNGGNLDSLTEAKKRSAYLSEKEVEVDDWLEDDLGPTRKKQKKFFNESINKSREGSPIRGTQNDTIFTRKSSINLVASESDDENRNVNGNFSDFDVNTIDAYDVLMSTNGEGGSKKKNRRDSYSKLSRKNSNQSSLLDAGFSKFIEFDDSSSRKSFPSPIKTSNTTTHNFNFNDSMSRGSAVVSQQTFIKVQIDGEKIIVPINKDAAAELKISWLIDESSRRYYCLKGIRPEIKLKTADGAILMDDDPLSIILCLTEENLIFSEILDWKLPTLSNRYLEACSEYKCVVDRNINELLDLNRTSVNIVLSNQNLHPVIIRPIVKAFHHQHCLSYLDLSNNFIQDEGLKYLTQALVTLKSLSFIDLSGNSLTENGIEYFCTTLEKSAAPVEIKQLKLNFNPIKSCSLKCLSELCRSKSITSLSLVSCKLIDLNNEIESFYNLKELNISYNHFTHQGLRNFLRKLNSTCVESLNFDRCTNDANVGETLANFFTSNCLLSTIKELNLSGLKLNENEILDILRWLQKCENLKSLDVSHQLELTTLSLKFILFNMNNENLSVNLVGCHKLAHSFDIKHNHDQMKAPRHLQMSLPRTKSHDETNEFITKVKDLWMTATESRGTVNQDKNILHLLNDNRNVHEFL